MSDARIGPGVHPRAAIDGELAQAESPAASGIAREQFAHGLLETYHLDKASDRERRITSMLSSLDDRAGPVLSMWRLRWRIVSGVAAAIALTSLILLGTLTQTSATAMVQESLVASRQAGDRRYEVRVKLPRGESLEAEPIATLDVRDADHVLMRAKSPFGDRIVLGRNGEGAWGIRPDGTVDRYPPREAWPRWVDFGQSTVLLVPVEELMTSLEQSYTLTRLEREASPAGGGPKCDRIRAEHKPGPSPDPRRVELWLDPVTKIVRRMELHWNPPRPGPGGPGGPGRGRPDRPPPDGLDDGGADWRPPDGPPGPPDGPPPEGGEDRGPPEGGRPPPPRPRPPGGPRHRPPEFVGGPPDFRRRPPPPRQLVFELIDGAAFAETWFDPATHSK